MGHAPTINTFQNAVFCILYSNSNLILKVVQIVAEQFGENAGGTALHS